VVNKWSRCCEEPKAQRKLKVECDDKTAIIMIAGNVCTMRAGFVFFVEINEKSIIWYFYPRQSLAGGGKGGWKTTFFTHSGQ
jgi:hypothetical protein